MEVNSGYQFRFTTDHSVQKDGFDICCPSTPRPTIEESYDLYGGDGTTRGNLYLNGQPVCDNNWNRVDADVVCRKMGFDYGSHTCCSAFGRVFGNFIMSDVQCDGGESSIWDCPHLDSSYYMGCNSWDGAGVECHNDDNGPDTVELVGKIAVLVFIICSVCFFIYC